MQADGSVTQSQSRCRILHPLRRQGHVDTATLWSSIGGGGNSGLGVTNVAIINSQAAVELVTAAAVAEGEEIEVGSLKAIWSMTN